MSKLSIVLQKQPAILLEDEERVEIPKKNGSALRGVTSHQHHTVTVRAQQAPSAFIRSSPIYVNCTPSWAILLPDLRPFRNPLHSGFKWLSACLKHALDLHLRKFDKMAVKRRGIERRQRRDAGWTSLRGTAPSAPGSPCFAPFLSRLCSHLGAGNSALDDEYTNNVNSAATMTQPPSPCTDTSDREDKCTRTPKLIRSSNDGAQTTFSRALRPRGSRTSPRRMSQIARGLLPLLLPQPPSSHGSASHSHPSAQRQRNAVSKSMAKRPFLAIGITTDMRHDDGCPSPFDGGKSCDARQFLYLLFPAPHLHSQAGGDSLAHLHAAARSLEDEEPAELDGLAYAPPTLAPPAEANRRGQVEVERADDVEWMIDVEVGVEWAAEWDGVPVRVGRGTTLSSVQTSHREAQGKEKEQEVQWKRGIALLPASPTHSQLSASTWSAACDAHLPAVACLNDDDDSKSLVGDAPMKRSGARGHIRATSSTSAAPPLSPSVFPHGHLPSPSRRWGDNRPRSWKTSPRPSASHPSSPRHNPSQLLATQSHLSASQTQSTYGAGANDNGGGGHARAVSASPARLLADALARRHVQARMSSGGRISRSPRRPAYARLHRVVTGDRKARRGRAGGRGQVRAVLEFGERDDILACPRSCHANSKLQMRPKRKNNSFRAFAHAYLNAGAEGQEEYFDGLLGGFGVAFSEGSEAPPSRSHFASPESNVRGVALARSREPSRVESHHKRRRKLVFEFSATRIEVGVQMRGRRAETTSFCRRNG
ncbi:hypothetical protein C8R45DRAFT_946848 [Mycena sanguinolenta]|nr:hypothetical protein C8R45DRAFT_946848 [Mycena sanguinolenta]